MARTSNDLGFRASVTAAAISPLPAAPRQWQHGRGDMPSMPLFSRLDLTALVWFLAAWIGYGYVVEFTPRGLSGLNGLMHRYRQQWMDRMLARDARMLDGQVISALQNGTAFFASTSLIALGGAVTLFRSTEDMLTVVAALPFGAAVTHTEWEVKVMGLI